MRIARGVTRTVLIGRRYVIKFPALRRPGRSVFYMFKYGVKANRTELRYTRKGIWGINPVLFHIGFVNVYRYCEPVMVPDCNTSYFCYEDLIQFGNVDPKPCNLGVLNGRVVFVDYG